MKSEAFLKEVLNSDCCPADFESIYKKFQGYQQAAIDTLNEFHRVCEKNSIRYQLAYGSLLGAIRDNGQIPWDYDIDVFVPFCDKDTLIESLKRDLDEKFYFYCPENDPKCRHFFIRLAPKGYRTEALHVDVFYLMGVPDDEEKRIALCRAVKFNFNSRFVKLVNIAEESMKRPKRIARMLLDRVKLLHIPLKKINEEFYSSCEEYPMDNYDHCATVDIECGKFIFNTDKLWNTTLLKTDTGEFRITQNYEEVLTQIYGDYKKIYPIEGRVNEVMRSYKRLEYFHKKK